MWIFITGLAFEDLFRGFGADLPWFTSTVLEVYKFNGLLLLVGLVPYAMLVKERKPTIKRRTRLTKLVVLGFGLALTSLAVFTTAMYLPVFQMGTVQ
jgi:type II secretory pathway component PulF